MKKAAIVISLLFTTSSVNAQKPMTKTPLKEGVGKITYPNLNISTLLQVYGKESARHLIGDVYLKVDNSDKTIAEFYIDNDESTKAYYTKVYKNYFLNFVIEDDGKYLIIEEAQFGKAFALSSDGSMAIGDEDGLVEIEIVDFIHESGYDAPLEDQDRSHYDDVNYTLEVKEKGHIKSFSFYSSEIDSNYVIDIGSYKIQILSDLYKDSAALIEMMVDKKD